MATGFYIPDGRDFSSIFTAGNAGFTSGFKQANGQDLGNIFVGGNSGVATKYFNVNTDMGNKLGITKSYEQVLINTRKQLLDITTYTINKTISKIEYTFISSSSASISLIINNSVKLKTTMVNPTLSNKRYFVDVNQYVTTLKVVPYEDSDGYYPMVDYLKLYGSYIQ